MVSAKTTMPTRTEQDRAHPLQGLAQMPHDIRLALRRLRKSPAFTGTVILTLGLGIGATTAIFTLVHAVMLRSLPVSNPDQLYRVGKKTHCCVWGGYSQSEEFSVFSNDLYKYLRDQTTGFESMAAFQAGQSLFGVRREHSASPAETYTGEFVSGNYFATFGVPAYAGRALTPADDQKGAAPAAMISYQVWRQRFGFDRGVIGGVFDINGNPFTVVGVTPPGFYGAQLRPTPPDVYLPLSAEPIVQRDSSLLDNVDQHWLDIIGRVRSGTDVGTLQAQMRIHLLAWLRAHQGAMAPQERTEIAKQTMYLSPGGAGIVSMREEYEHRLQILLLVAGFVLLIVCANVANLMMVRGLERSQQTSLSMALGARPVRMILQALTESVLLSLAGGLAGLAVAFAGTRFILWYAFDPSSAIGVGTVPISASPSLPVLLFAFFVSLLTGLAFGIAPAWMASRSDPVEALRGANRSTKQSGSVSRKVLVILQAALSLVLLTTAGLLSKTLSSLEHQDFGFEPDRRVVLNIDPVLAGYKPEQLEPLYRRIHDSLAAIPGVESVAIAQYSPLSGDSWNSSIHLAGKREPPPGQEPESSWTRISPGFFSLLGNEIVKGRPITEQDTAGSRHVAVVNEAFVKKFLEGEYPLGRQFGQGPIEMSHEYEIVGVAKDMRYLGYNMQDPVKPFFYVPLTQWTNYPKPGEMSGETRSHFIHDILVLMRPGSHLGDAPVRRAMSQIDPNLPVLRMRALSAQVSSSFGQERLIARLTSLFGLLALVLASVGLYGVTAYNAGTRVKEIGVRMALGADRGRVLTLILRGAFVLIGFGLLLGVPLSLAAGRFLGNQLHGVSAYDPAALVIAVLALALPASIAALVPALRASWISPMDALRLE